MTPPNRYVSNLVQGLSDCAPFTGPEHMERARGRSFEARLGANENGFGPSPRALEVMRGAAGENWMYADPDNFELLERLALHYGVARDNVLVGEGIDGLLDLAIKATVNPGETVVTSNGAYPTFNHHVACQGGRLVKISYREDLEDLQGLCEAARVERAKVVYVSNPDNPMGSVWGADDLLSFEKELSPDALLFLDEAYVETAPQDSVLALDPQNPRVIRFRTFSKAYGLAGARIGYVIAHSTLIGAMDKVRNQYGINRVGQLGALAALRDQAYLSSVVEKIGAARDRIAVIARENGLVPLPSGANFVTIDCGGEGAFARRVLDEVVSRDVFIRMPSVAPLNRCIRVTAGPPDEVEAFAGVLPEALKAARSC